MATKSLYFVNNNPGDPANVNASQDLDERYAPLDTTITAGSGLIGGGALSPGAGNNNVPNASLTISHANTSNQASVNGSGGIVVQDVTLDGFGHVIGLGTVDLDNRYATSGDIPDVGDFITEAEADARYVNVSGDTMTGFLTLSGNPTSNNHAATKKYVDDQLGGVSPGDSNQTITTGSGIDGANSGSSGDITITVDTSVVRTSGNQTIGGAKTFTSSITSNGDVISTSDVRTKSNIEQIRNALVKVEELNGYTFIKEGSNRRHTGVIAQEVQEVLPEAVSVDSEGTLSVAYGNMVGLLIEAIKEQQHTINSLQERIKILEDK